MATPSGLARDLRDAGVPESDIGWFTTLGTFIPQFGADPGLDPVLSYFQEDRNILAEKLSRLMEIVRRLEDRR